MLLQCLHLEQHELLEGLHEDLEGGLVLVLHDAESSVGLAAQMIRQKLLYLFDLSVDAAEVAEESLTHFGVALDLLDDPLLVQSQYVIFEYQLIGKALVLYRGVASIKFYDLALRGRIGSSARELLVILETRSEVVGLGPPPVLKDLLPLERSLLALR